MANLHVFHMGLDMWNCHKSLYRLPKKHVFNFKLESIKLLHDNAMHQEVTSELGHGNFMVQKVGRTFSMMDIVQASKLK